MALVPTTTHFVIAYCSQKDTRISLNQKTDRRFKLSARHFQQACSQLIEPLEEYEDTLEEDTLQGIWSSSLNDHTYGGSQIIDNNAESRPESVITRSLSRCSSSSSFPPTPTISRALTCMKPISKKVVPPIDDFAKRKKRKSETNNLDEQLAEADTAISDTMNTVSTLIISTANKNKEKDGYMLAIEEELIHIPAKSRT